MNLIDSSGWLSYFANTKNAEHFAYPIEKDSNILVPTIVIYEVFKVILREKNEQDAIIAQAYLQQGTVVELTTQLALSASKLSLLNCLPMADSIILATALEYNATIWTQDEHFNRFQNVKFFPHS
jgi:predicted nucleic acid-binding protein